MPNVELSEEELAELAALRSKKAAPEQASAADIPGLAAPGEQVRPIPPKAKRPTDRAKPSTPKLGQAHKQATADSYNLGTKRQGEERDLQLPSGALCRVLVIGPESLMSSGLLDSVDSLTAIVSGDLIPKAETGVSKIDPERLAKDMTAMKQIMDKYDELTMKVVIQPTLHPAPETEAEREDGLAYIDQVSFEDKAFIMQYVMGGTTDLETFRQESEATLAGVAAEPGTAGSSE